MNERDEWDVTSETQEERKDKTSNSFEYSNYNISPYNPPLPVINSSCNYQAPETIISEKPFNDKDRRSNLNQVVNSRNSEKYQPSDQTDYNHRNLNFPGNPNSYVKPVAELLIQPNLKDTDFRSEAQSCSPEKNYQRNPEFKEAYIQGDIGVNSQANYQIKPPSLLPHSFRNDSKFVINMGNAVQNNIRPPPLIRVPVPNPERNIINQHSEQVSQILSHVKLKSEPEKPTPSDQSKNPQLVYQNKLNQSPPNPLPQDPHGMNNIPLRQQGLAGNEEKIQKNHSKIKIPKLSYANQVQDLNQANNSVKIEFAGNGSSNFIQRNVKKQNNEGKRPENIFGISKDLQEKITGFCEAFRNLDLNFVTKIVIENQGCTEEEIYLKLQQPVQTPIPSFFELSTYKTYPCPKGFNCSDFMCIYYHSLAEKRRIPETYSEKHCESYPNCPKRENCNFSHNPIESIYHSSMIYKAFCPHENCYLARACPFQHIQTQRLTLLGRLKSELDKNTEDEKKLQSTLIELKLRKDKQIEMINYFRKKIMCRGCNEKGVIVKQGCGHLLCKNHAVSPFCFICEVPSKSILLKG